MAAESGAMASVKDSISVRDPAVSIALIRIVVGLYFAKALVTKLTVALVEGFLPVPQVSARWVAAMPHIVAKQASANPLLFYQYFLDRVVLPHATPFAHLTAWGEAAVGIGLTLGLLTPVAAGLGLFLVTSYGLATQWMSPEQRGFHLLLAATMIAFVLARAGRTWGVDGWIDSRTAGRPEAGSVTLN
jgi:thiosulfate dehydrogenase (quinone) large subunit